jgi:2EXR family
MNNSSINEEVRSPEFLLFPKLLIELRLKIWGYMPDPRIVEVVWETGESDSEGEDDNEEHGRYLTRTPTPTLLQICGESRQEALRISNYD